VDQFSKLAVNLIIVALTAVASVAPASAAVFFFENNAGITINDSGPATPYPSTINVSGVTGRITHVVVRLRISHQNPQEVDILLVNPGGLRTAMLMSDAGGTTNIQGVNLTFSECAPRLLGTPIVSGTYRSSNYPTPFPDVLPAPAPAEPYGPGLAEFVGTRAATAGAVNGEWKLFVNDAAPGGTGFMAFWNITIFTDAEVPGGGTPVPCGKPDFDGDGRADIAIYRGGGWFILRSSDGVIEAVGFGGFPEDKPVPADYDGDGVTDIAIYRGGGWFILRSTDGGVTVEGFGGLAQDIPAPADYDGDGKADIALYRDGNWFIRRSSDGVETVTNIGFLPGDVPIKLTPTE
jgi:subtilisin-like proprotein convertase family protein